MRRPPRRSAIRRVVPGCALVLAGAGAALALAELLLRLFLPQPLLHDPDAFLPDPVLGGRLKPGFADTVTTTEFTCRWEINADGHRGPRCGERGPAGPVLAAAGDSFTFGYGVEEPEAWPRRLESAVRAEVINLGVGGYGTWQEVVDLERRWPELHPEIVLLAFYPGNDLGDNLRGRSAERAAAGAGAAGAVAGGEAAAAGPARAERLKRWLGSRLHLYSLVSTRADELLVRAGLRQVVYPEEIEVLIDPPPAPIREGWAATGEALERLARLARANGARAAVILVPMKHQVSRRFRERAFAYYERIAGAGQARFDRDLPRRELAALCEGAGLPLLDLTPSMAAPEAGGEAERYWPRDQHFNRAGHDAAAAAVAAWLLERGWVEAR